MPPLLFPSFAPASPPLSLAFLRQSPNLCFCFSSQIKQNYLFNILHIFLLNLCPHSNPQTRIFAIFNFFYEALFHRIWDRRFHPQFGRNLDWKLGFHGPNRSEYWEISRILTDFECWLPESRGLWGAGRNVGIWYGFRTLKGSLIKLVVQFKLHWELHRLEL